MLRPLFILLISLLFAASADAQGAAAIGADVVPPIPFQQRVLPNGLTVVSSVDRTTPNVTVQVWYHVGGKDDPPGRSGFAHLFEHMMFKATRDMPAEFMDRLTEDVGGMNNAFTEDDTTAFYEVIPAAHLQRLLWAEAERMSALVVDKSAFTSERQVVEEELRQRVLADPYGRFYGILIPEHTFAIHPYRHDPIGSIADLDAATLDDVQAFHATFYRPDNAVLVVVGNFDPARLTAWVGQYFGPLADPATAIPRVSVKEPTRTGPATYTGYGPDVPLPAIAISWLAPAAASPDAAPLKVLDSVLTTGKSSRLYDSLVYRRQIAQQVFSSNDLREQLGLEYVGAVAAPGHTLGELETALRAEVADLRDHPVSAEALETAKAQLLTGEIRARETIDGRANELGAAAVLEGSAARANTDIDALATVTAADVQRVAQTWLPDDRRVVIRYLQAGRGAASEALPAPPPAASKHYPGAVPALLPEGQRAQPPPIGAQPPAELPSPVERTLPNGLRVIVARSTGLPLVSASLAAAGGAGADPPGLAGDATLTAAVLPEGTPGRSAEEIARQSEALGGTLAGSAGIDGTSLELSVMPSKLPDALALMADVAENPTFAPAEVERARKAALDAYDVAAGDPEAVASLASAPLVYAGTPFAHARSGSTRSLKRLTRDDLVRFHLERWRPDNAVLVLTGDVTPEEGFRLAAVAFSGWARPAGPPPPAPAPRGGAAAPARQVAIDLPGAGQAAVVVAKPSIQRADPRFYPALVANAVLGEGFSSRLNEEIRIKRGLSYGAGSELGAHRAVGAVIASATTRNDAASLVAGLTEATMAGLAATPPDAAELQARETALIGDYGRNIATAEGLGETLETLVLEGASTDEIGAYPTRVMAVTPQAVQAVAGLFSPADASLLVVGDAKAFLPALKAKYPGLQSIPIAAFDPESPALTAPKP